ncbi:MAG: glutamate/aspartate ABC transporter substrate-binding protein [Polaromonas sp.]
MKKVNSLVSSHSVLGRAVAAAAVLACASVAVAAEPELSGTLKKIKDDGVLVVGYRESSIPFSYYDSSQVPVGYSMDFTNLAIEQIKKQLKLPNLQVRKLPITSQNRISLLQNGTFDFECTTTTNNESRAQQVDFTNSIFQVGTRLLVKKGSGINDFTDLASKTVVVGAGTTSEKILHNLSVDKKLDMRIISAKDHSESFLMLSTGRAKAMMMDDALLAGERAKTKDPAEYEIVGTPQSHESYGCMVRKNDAGLKTLLNETIAKAQTSGEATKIYSKWFMNPIPPRGLNLGFPMSDAMKKLYASPNDKP